MYRCVPHLKIRHWRVMDAKGECLLCTIVFILIARWPIPYQEMAICLSWNYCKYFTVHTHIAHTIHEYIWLWPNNTRGFKKYVRCNVAVFANTTNRKPFRCITIHCWPAHVVRLLPNIVLCGCTLHVHVCKCSGAWLCEFEWYQTRIDDQCTVLSTQLH